MTASRRLIELNLTLLLRLDQLAHPPELPVAAMPSLPGEVRSVYRGKVRPLAVIGAGGPEIPHALRLGAARWQSVPTILVCPFFGADQDGTRGGWRPDFVRRIRHLEYPQYMWDMLPLPGATVSILRLDHLQPISRHPQALSVLPHRLSAEALAVMDEQLRWLTTGILAAGVLSMVREELLPLP